MSKGVLAFDFGASSGRAILGLFEEGKITIREIHRFKNTPVYEGEHIYWDIDFLFNQVKKAMTLTDTYESIGVDTWGVDFCFINKEGKMLRKPANYRDPRTKGIIGQFSQKITSDKLYSMTGSQLMEINTLFQLYYELLHNKEIYINVDKVLLMPDLMNFLLTGEKRAERSIASTTQLVDPFKMQWNEYIMEQAGLKKDIFPEMIAAGTEIGLITESLAEELNIPRKTVIAVCEHDTASALAAVPADKEFIYISCGTWAIFGTELPEPVITDKSSAFNITNEIGINGTTAFLKNLTGLWLLQETKRQFESQGKNYTFNQMEELARAAEPFVCFIDTEDAAYSSPGDIPGKIREYAAASGQRVPETDGQILRCIYEGLAFKYRQTYEEMRECLNKSYEKLHMVGGGSRDPLLCQMTADSTGLEVMAGPVEATAIGNILVQLLARGEIKNIQEGRSIVKASFETVDYYPAEKELWNRAYEKYRSVIA